MRVVFIGLFFAALSVAATIRLYMKEGDWHLVREYQVLADRVRFYSVERGEWEEVPLELVDLKRTEQEIKRRQEAEKAEARWIDEEEKAEREARREAASVPPDPGAYYVDGKEIKPLKIGECKIHSNKRRAVLAAISPLPMIAGKATLELDGETSAFVVKQAVPEFYFRLSAPERFGMVKLTPSKGVRIVEKISIVPVSKEMIEEPILVEVFRRQVGEDLYKVWPVEPLEPGEYALVQYTEGKVNMQVWDFSYRKP
ncbi:MAG: hypothetical protein NZV14_05735 [Bryobacteraceae bacterium]|nr:hypothetical protein [Bryobacteraceae bacterium]MDW8377640.1 hypothetical protein [Bryobacterales bacterium]